MRSALPTIGLAMLVLLSLTPVALSVDVPYTLCSTKATHFNISSIRASAWPPAKGSADNVTVNGTLDEQVTGGTYSATAKWEGFPLPSSDGPVSEFKPVPWAKGTMQFDYAFPVPGTAPSGKYTATLSAVDQQKETLFCINLAFSLKAAEHGVGGESGRRSRVALLKQLTLTN